MKIFSFFVTVVFCLAGAQSTDTGSDTGGTESCAYLLEQPQPTDLPDLTSVETTMTFESIVDGEAYSTKSYNVFDLTGRRVYQRTDFDADNSVTITRYVDGKATMTIDSELLDEEEQSSPPGLTEQLEAQLNEVLDGGFTDPNQFDDAYELISCDGQRTYGEVLAGEQVSARLREGDLLPGTSGQVTRTLFDDDGQAKGSLVEIPEFGMQLIVFESTKMSDAGLTEHMVIRTYNWDGEQAEHTGTMTLEYIYNQPIDESLFE